MEWKCSLESTVEPVSVYYTVHDFVLSKAKDPSPTNGVSPKSGETGSSAGGSGKSGSGDDVVPVDASSAGSVSLKKVEKILWMTIVLVLALGVTI